MMQKARNLIIFFPHSTTDKNTGFCFDLYEYYFSIFNIFNE